MSLVFERSVGGALGDGDILECGICWREYDPIEGDDSQDIAPGTAFADLPDHWRCPQCDAPQSKFMVKEKKGGAATSPAIIADIPTRVERLIAAYREAEKDMLGLPIHNGALDIEAVGFRELGANGIGVIVTPWCMNLVLLPSVERQSKPGALGSKTSYAFPFGTFSFVLGQMEGVGLIETCSLFSPMDDFPDHQSAVTVAQEAIDGLFEVDQEEMEKRRQKQSRRSILGGRRHAV
ncbi:MAG: [NiFe]-hydrogenase assembly chaperone HybE [Pseudomonadota bacterium]